MTAYPSFVLTPICPCCGNNTVYVEVLEPSVTRPDADDCQCRCGKCSMRFEMTTPRDAWFVPYLLPGSSIGPLAPTGEILI